MINNNTFYRFIHCDEESNKLYYQGKIIYDGLNFSLYKRNFINSALISNYKHFKREEAIMRFEPYNCIIQYKDNLLYIYKKQEDIHIVLTKKHYNFKLFILFIFGWGQN